MTENTPPEGDPRTADPIANPAWSMGLGLNPDLDPAPPAGPAAKLPFSQAAVWGFALSCLSIFVFGFVGALGAVISARGFRATRRGTARGRGLAIAGMIIGTIGFLYYAVVFIVAHTS